MLNFLSKFGLKPYKKQVVVHGFIRPRPLQNRVPRVQVLLPCQEMQASLCGACIFCLCVKFLKRGTRVPGNKRDRCRWQMKGAFVGAAVGKIKEKRKPADFSGLPQEGIVCLLPLPKIKALKFRSTARFQGSFLFDKTLNFLTGAVCTPFFNAQIGLQIVQPFRPVQHQKSIKLLKKFILYFIIKVGTFY